MVERELVREKEAGVQLTTQYDESIRRYRKVREEARTGTRVIKRNKIPFQSGRQGIVKFYALRQREGLCMKNMAMFVQEIKTHSGQHRHQGGMNIFVLNGGGYTILDGKRVDWREGDLVLLPFKKGGIVHQHFNMKGKPSRWLAMLSLPMSDMISGMMEQRANQPDWKEKLKEVNKSGSRIFNFCGESEGSSGWAGG